MMVYDMYNFLWDASEDSTITYFTLTWEIPAAASIYHSPRRDDFYFRALAPYDFAPWLARRIAPAAPAVGRQRPKRLRLRWLLRHRKQTYG